MDPEGSQKNIVVVDPVPIIGPGHTLASVTDKISSIVLTPGMTKGWLGGFTVAVCLFLLLNVVMTYLFAFGVGIWGINIPVAWAFAITNFVWWIGIGHAGTLDFGVFAADAPAVAYLHQPICRGDDDFCSDVRGDVPASAHGATVDVLLHDAVSQSHVAVAAISQSFSMGRLRGVHVFHRFPPILVCGAYSRSGDAARPRQKPRFPDVLRSVGDGVARLGSALVALRVCVVTFGRV